MTMSDAEQLLEDARISFRLASDSFQATAVEHYAEMGRHYLRLSHEAAKIVILASKPPSKWWRFP
jgi:hypothetical protein